MSFWQRLVGWLLRRLPEADRRSYGDEMAHLFARRSTGVRGLRWSRRARFLTRELVGIARAVVLARRDRRPALRRPRLGLSGIHLEFRAVLRSFARRPTFLPAAVGTLALGLGVNAAVTAIGWNTVLAPLPYPDAEQLVRVFHDPDLSFGVSFNELATYRSAADAFVDLAGWQLRGTTIEDPEAPARVTRALVTPNLFSVVGIRPEIGRTFAPDGSRAEVVLSHASWMARFSGSPDVVGRRLVLDGEVRRVVGVLPEGLVYPDAGVELYTSIDMTAQYGEGRGGLFLDVVGRIAPGHDLEGAAAEVAALAARMRLARPEAYQAEPRFGGFVTTLRGARDRDRTAMILALVAGSLLMLAATMLNVVTLLVARTARRQSELAVRRHLGASDGHVAVVHLLEAILLAALGSAAGLAVALTIPDLIGAQVGESLLGPDASWASTVLSMILVGGAVLAAVLTAVPWVAGRRARLDGQAGITPNRMLGLAAWLQVAVAVMLVSSSVLLGRTVLNLARIDVGYRTDHTVTAALSLPTARYSTETDARLFYDRLRERLLAVPSVSSVGVVSALPLGGTGGSGDVYVRSIDPDSAVDVVAQRIADAGYFRTLAIPLLAGRSFTPADAAGAPRVALVDELFARRFFGGVEAALGGEIRMFFGGEAWNRIVGVVGHTMERSPAVPGGPQVYVPLAQRSTRGAHLVVRHVGEPNPVLGAVAGEVRAIDPSLPVFDVRTMESRLRGSIARERLVLWVFGGFGTLALSLASLGAYGMIRMSVEARRKEIGIRRALGASATDVARAIGSVGARALTIGIAVGLIGSAGIGLLMRGLVFGIPPTDPLSLAASATVVSSAAVLASLIPFRAALRLPPIEAIRDA